MSPFELFGLVGPGVALHVSKTLNANLGPRYRISPTVQRLVDNGVKSFYIKDESGKQIPNPSGA
jgi:3-hydroxyacyl-CoA dehydrogenase